MPLPTIRQLQYLQAVSECLNFSLAADQCFVTQSTLSSGIKELESLLGTQVIERTKRKVLLTPVGKNVLAKGQEILRLAQEIEFIAKENNTPLSGPIRLGVIPTIAPFLLPQLLPILHEKFPHAQFSILEDLSANLMQKLQTGRLDILLLALPYESAGTITMTIAEDEFLLAEPEDAEKTSQPLTLNSFSQEEREVLLLEDGHCLRDHALAACRLDTASDAFRASSLHTLIALVAQGAGITLLPAMSTNPNSPGNFSQFTGVRIKSFSDPKPVRWIGLCWRKSTSRDSDFNLLGNFLKDWMKSGLNPN